MSLPFADSTARALDERQPADEAGPGGGMAVVRRTEAAAALLDPIRRRVLEALQRTGSASSIAGEVGLSRQRTNYHVRALERAGLVEEVGRRGKRGLTERLVRATAAYYVISPAAVGQLDPSPGDTEDRFSATFQVALAARTIREVAELSARAGAAGQRLATMALDTEVQFASPGARAAFGAEFLEVVAALAAKYHDPSATDGRRFRVFAGAHPVFVPDPENPKRPS
jgi:DNA-binding transcriptional ArsR family regulator